MNFSIVIVALVACGLHTALAVSDSMACKGMCPRNYAPVCGMDNSGNMKTFANKCMFEYEECNNRDAGWQIVKSNTCDSDSQGEEALPAVEKTECNGRCTREYKPVCGMDNTGFQRTFANKCVFEFEQCSNRDEGWKMIAEHSCGTVRPTTVGCRKACTLEYAPVCGVNFVGNKQTFANKCSFEVEECNNRDEGWKLLKHSACEGVSAAPTKCNKACTFDYRPVCGVNQFGKMQTFGNKCTFEVEQCENRDEGWKLLTNRACEEATVVSTPCNKVCTLEYAPVCGVNNLGKMLTFGNKCAFEVEQCNNRDDGWKLTKHSACEEVSAAATTACKNICTLEYRPVCGVNQFGEKQTFGNKCGFEATECNNRDEGWKLLKNSACEEVRAVKAPVCRTVCTLEFRPVCGINNLGKTETFPNPCAFEVEACNNRDEGWKLLHNQSC